MDDELVLDGNAAAGTLAAVFGRDVTASDATCGHCGTVSLIGSWRAYLEGPGTVLRCPACGGVVIRIALISGRHVVDARGIAALRLGD